MARKQCQGSSRHDPGKLFWPPSKIIYSLNRYDQTYIYHLLQVFLGHNGVRDLEGNDLPRLVYVSREKRPGFDHHKKAGAMNSLVDLSPFLYVLGINIFFIHFFFLLLNIQDTSLGNHLKCSLHTQC